MFPDTTGELGEIQRTAVKRAGALGVLVGGPLSKREFESELGVSTATAHRVLTSLADQDLVERTGAGYTLTGLGYGVVGEVERYDRNVRLLQRLEPLLDVLDLASLDVDLSVFSDPTVTVATADDPYVAFRRVAELIGGTDSLCIVSDLLPPPSVLEAVADGVAAGMAFEYVAPPETIETLIDAYPEAVDVLESESVTFWSYESAYPCFLLLLDERVCLGGHDPETRMAKVCIDSADPLAVAWSETFRDWYVAEAEPYEAY